MSSKFLWSWKRISLAVLILVSIVLAVQAGRLLHSRLNRTRNGQIVRKRPIPYTVTLREIVHAPDGTTRVTGEITFAVRTDGSTAFKGSHGRNLYFSSGLAVGTNDTEHTKTSMNVPSQMSGSLNRDPNSNCLNALDGQPITSPPETFIGEEIISGYRTAKIADGIITSWHALDYGCALVKDRWEFGPTEVSEKELVAISAGEPNPDLFNVPLDYREAPPSETLLGNKKQCHTCDEKTSKRIQMMDEAYKRRVD